MSEKYLGSDAIRPMEQAMWKLCNKKGYDPHTAFTGLLDYILGYFDPEGNPVEGWRFDNEDNKAFYDIMNTYFDVQKEQSVKLGWYDAFGDLYMALHTKGGGKGQYFTPMDVANTVAKINLGEVEYNEGLGTHTPMGKRIVVADPAAGSGRLALAGYSILLSVMQQQWGWDYSRTKSQRPYVCVEDLDYNCVKMCAINLAMHGCYGEAVCHDTLTEPGIVRLGYIIGEADYPFPSGIPSIRKEMRPERFVTCRHWLLQQQKHQADEQKEPPKSIEHKASPTPSSEKREQPQQLSLW